MHTARMSTTHRVLSQDETIQLLLGCSGRPDATVPIRHDFVQKGIVRAPEPGPFAGLVSGHARRALALFLLIHAVASGRDFSIAEWATTWARILGLYHDRSGPQAVSRVWKRLEDDKLIERARGKGGRTKITVLLEDGSGKPYTRPHERYLKLPYEYWTAPERWYSKLSLAANAMLLICLTKMKEPFDLPLDQVPKWYGISDKTV
jgi:hypothetical protein